MKTKSLLRSHLRKLQSLAVLGMGLGILGCVNAFAASGVSMEAENMTLTNYAVNANTSASNGNLIKVNASATGTAAYTFSGSTGTYDIKVWYYDENDGACALKLYVNGVVVDSWTANQSLGSADPVAATRTSRTKAGVSITNGNEIKLEGTQNSQEWARFDNVEVTAVGGIPSGTTMEAEIMALTNYATEAVAAASGGTAIKIPSTGTGNARYTFSGTTGTYDIKVWYFDENDGASALKLYVNGAVVDSWTANLDLGSTVPDAASRTSRTKANVSVTNGNEIKIEGTVNSQEFARFDKVEVLTPSSWVLTWSDEFSGTGDVDGTKWDQPSYNRRNNSSGPDGYWDAAYVYKDGAGHMEIKVDRVANINGDGDPHDYKVGAARTAGKFTQTYGKFEALHQMPQKQGWWVAFWMMQGNQGSVGNGGVDGSEVDIMEGWGWTDKIQRAIHWDGYGADHQSVGSSAVETGIRTGWHTFTLIWDPDKYYFYIDGALKWETIGGGVCNQPGYIKVTGEISTESWAITTSWAKTPEGITYPDYFRTDWVRVYQRQ